MCKNQIIYAKVSICSKNLTPKFRYCVIKSIQNHFQLAMTFHFCFSFIEIWNEARQKSWMNVCLYINFKMETIRIGFHDRYGGEKQTNKKPMVYRYMASCRAERDWNSAKRRVCMAWGVPPTNRIFYHINLWLSITKCWFCHTNFMATRRTEMIMSKVRKLV